MKKKTFWLAAAFVAGAACWVYALLSSNLFFLILGIVIFIVATQMAHKISSKTDEIPVWLHQPISDGLMALVLGSIFSALFLLGGFFYLLTEQAALKIQVLAMGTLLLISAVVLYFARVRFLKK